MNAVITPASHWAGEPPLIAFDLDGTVLDWGNRLNRILLDLDPSFPIVDDDSRTGFGDLMGPGGDREVLKAALAHDDLYRDMEAYPGAVEMIHATAAAGYQILLASTPDVSNPHCAGFKQADVRRHFGSDWDTKLVLAHDKTVLNAVVLVDDKPEITGIHTPSWIQVFPDQSWNRHVVDAIRLHAWADWPQVLHASLLAAGQRPA